MVSGFDWENEQDPVATIEKWSNQDDKNCGELIKKVAYFDEGLCCLEKSSMLQLFTRGGLAFLYRDMIGLRERERKMSKWNSTGVVRESNLWLRIEAEISGWQPPSKSASPLVQVLQSGPTELEFMALILLWCHGSQASNLMTFSFPRIPTVVHVANLVICLDTRTPQGATYYLPAYGLAG